MGAGQHVHYDYLQDGSMDCCCKQGYGSNVAMYILSDNSMLGFIFLLFLGIVLVTNGMQASLVQAM